MVVNKRVGRWGKLRQTQLRRRSVLWKMIISLEWVFAVRERIKMAEVGRDKLRGWLVTQIFLFSGQSAETIFS